MEQDINTSTTFQELVDKFEDLFQVKIDPTEVLKEYYVLQQQVGASVA
jgi:acyl carrier protein